MQYYCTDDIWYPLHQIIYFSNNTDLIKFGIDKHIGAGLDLYCENCDHNTILKFIFKYGTYDVIAYALTKIDKNDHRFIDCKAVLNKALKENKYYIAHRLSTS